MVRHGSQVVDHAFDFQTRLAKIKEQAEPDADRFEIIEALHPMHDVQRFDGLQLDQQQQYSTNRSGKVYSPTTTSL